MFSVATTQRGLMIPLSWEASPPCFRTDLSPGLLGVHWSPLACLFSKAVYHRWFSQRAWSLSWKGQLLHEGSEALSR